MIKDGDDPLESCLLLLFNCMLTSRWAAGPLGQPLGRWAAGPAAGPLSQHFPERLSVATYRHVTAVYKSADISDVSNCQRHHSWLCVCQVVCDDNRAEVVCMGSEMLSQPRAGRTQKRLSYNR